MNRIFAVAFLLTSFATVAIADGPGMPPKGKTSPSAVLADGPGMPPKGILLADGPGMPPAPDMTGLAV